MSSNYSLIAKLLSTRLVADARSSYFIHCNTIVKRYITHRMRRSRNVYSLSIETGQVGLLGLRLKTFVWNAAGLRMCANLTIWQQRNRPEGVRERGMWKIPATAAMTRTPQRQLQIPACTSPGVTTIYYMRCLFTLNPQTLKTPQTSYFERLNLGYRKDV